MGVDGLPKMKIMIIGDQKLTEDQQKLLTTLEEVFTHSAEMILSIGSVPELSSGIALLDSVPEPKAPPTYDMTPYLFDDLVSYYNIRETQPWEKSARHAAKYLDLPKQKKRGNKR